jgi:hypothetical protein
MPFLCVLLMLAPSVSAEQPGIPVHNNIKTVNRAFAPGEKLTFSITWSNIVRAGIAVMEVRTGAAEDHQKTLHLVSSTRSVGMVDTFYRVRDSVESIMDADELYSVGFKLRENHGKKRRERDMTFDHDNGTVRVTVNGSVETHAVPVRVQDALSSLYYVRTRQDFVVGKPIIVDIHDSGKNWSVEIQTVGKERIATPAGDFDTIKVRTYPKYEGVFMHKGEIFIWLTDDARRMPVLMKSRISIGSIVATLTEFQEGQKHQ